MKNEDDTYDRLKRSSIKTVISEITNTMFMHPVDFENILKRHGWTPEEYTKAAVIHFNTAFNDKQ